MGLIKHFFVNRPLQKYLVDSMFKNYTYYAINYFCHLLKIETKKFNEQFIQMPRLIVYILICAQYISFPIVFIF